MILVYRGEIYTTSEEARVIAEISREEVNGIVDELWMDGRCAACWRLFRDGASDADLKQARLDTINEAEFLLQSEKKSRNEAIAYLLSRVKSERSKWDKVMEKLSTLHTTREFIE